MNGFLRRVRRLQKLVRAYTPSYVTLIYNDGTERCVRGLEVVCEIMKDHNIVDIKCEDETGQSLFSALLEAEQEYGDNFDDLVEVE